MQLKLQRAGCSRRLRPRQTGGLQLQAAWLFPVLLGPAHAQTAAHLLNHVIPPHVPVRQWVLIWIIRLPIEYGCRYSQKPRKPGTRPCWRFG